MNAADPLSTARALRASGELMAAAELLHAELEVSQKPERVEQVGSEFASLLEIELEDLIAAAEVWQCVLDLIPGHLPALLALERIFMTAEMFYELVLIYERRLTIEVDADARVALHRRAATVCEELLADPYAAIDHLLRALDLRPDDALILDTLARLAEQEGIEDVVSAPDGSSPDTSEGAGHQAQGAAADKAIDPLLGALDGALGPDAEQALLKLTQEFKAQEGMDEAAAAPVTIPQVEDEG